MSEKLKPCPWCNSDQISIDEDFGPFGAQCDECHASGPICDTPETAAAEWNRRHQEQDTASTFERWVK